jgi:hypothetical protein
MILKVSKQQNAQGAVLVMQIFRSHFWSIGATDAVTWGVEEWG